MRRFRGRPRRARGAAGATSTAHVIPAALAVGDTPAEAVAVLALRILRASTVALVIFGVAIAIHVGQFSDYDAQRIMTVTGMVQGLFSPLVVLVIGFALRLALAPLALLAALVVVVSDDLDVRPAVDTRSGWTRMLDRWRLAAAVRGLRWTTAVKHEAARRLGRTGSVMVATEWAMRGLCVLGVLAVLLVAGG